VADVADGLIACALKGRPGEAYNIASGKETSVRELAERINALAGNSAGFLHLPRRPWDHSGKRFGSTAKSERELGFRARIEIEEGLRRTVEWTRANLALIKATIARHDVQMRVTT
jgi:nucleoside-diphosphate-sugar epimerase